MRRRVRVRRGHAVDAMTTRLLYSLGLIVFVANIVTDLLWLVMHPTFMAIWHGTFPSGLRSSVIRFYRRFTTLGDPLFWICWTELLIVKALVLLTLFYGLGLYR